MANAGPRWMPLGDAGDAKYAFDRRIIALKKRLVREATSAVSMLESALGSLWTLEADTARAVRVADDKIDWEEVEIEKECYELLTLHHPFARDFRIVTFILKVNSDIERVADHSVSIAKAVVKISKLIQPGHPVPKWPTSLVDLGHRVPAACHGLMRAVLDEDVDAAKAIVEGDEVIDQLDRRLFDEAMEMMKGESSEANLAIGMLVYRIGRELERIGDLMKNIAEDVIYLATGSIVRHEERAAKMKTNG